MTTGPAALLLAALLTSPALAESNSCDTAAARDMMAMTLPRAGDERPVNITYRTRAEGVKLPAYLLEQYPDEMNIILQYQFDRLVVRNDRFEVTVYFKGKPARLTVPFDAVKAFFDKDVAKCWGD
jgi:hypothetical protein